VISYKDIALQIISYSSQADYNCYRVIANFVPNFVAMATGIGGRKCNWQHSMAHPRKSPMDAKNLADISYTDRVLSQILFYGNRCRSEKCSLRHSIAHPRNPPPYRRKNLANIFYTSQVIANFVQNFVGMATGVGQGKMQLAAFDGPSLKTPL